ncbi:MAG: YceD family protein [bacterium]
MIIRFSGLKPGNYTYRFTLTDEFFEEHKNDEIEGGDVIFDIAMERLERMIMFHFSLSGEVRTLCDRCLGELTIPVNGEEHLCVRFSDTETCDDEDVVVLPENAFEIDLTQWLYEYVAVRIPMQHIHPDGECDLEVTRYIQVESGERKEESEEVDPRWEALRNLK